MKLQGQYISDKIKAAHNVKPWASRLYQLNYELFFILLFRITTIGLMIQEERGKYRL